MLFQLFLTSLLFVSTANASDYDIVGIKTSDLNKFFTTKSPCYLALGHEVDKTTKDYMWPDVLCVLDGTAGAGGAHEVSGCSLMILNTKSGRLRGTSPSIGGPDKYAIVNKDCTKGGFEDLLKKPAVVDQMSGKVFYSVGQVLIDGRGTILLNSRLLYSDRYFESIYKDIVKNDGSSTLKVSDSFSFVDKVKSFFEK